MYLDHLERIWFAYGKEAYLEGRRKEEAQEKARLEESKKRKEAYKKWEEERDLLYETWKTSQDDFIKSMCPYPNPEFVRWVKKTYPKTIKPFEEPKPFI